MTDYIALDRDDNFQSLFKGDGACTKTLEHCRHVLETKELSPYQQGKLQGQLYALTQLPEMVRQLAKKQEQDAVNADRERAEPEPKKRFLRPVP